MTERKILMVIAPEAYRDEELNVPRRIFEEKGYQVDVVSTRLGMAKGMLGATEQITQTLEMVKPDPYEAILAVGGMGSPQYLWTNLQLHEILRDGCLEGKVIGSICLSGAVLAKAGLLQGKNATVWEMPESLEALKQGGAKYTGEPVTIDGRVVTANGPEAAEAFAQSVLTLLQQKKVPIA